MAIGDGTELPEVERDLRKIFGRWRDHRLSDSGCMNEPGTTASGASATFYGLRRIARISVQQGARRTASAMSAILAGDVALGSDRS